MNSIDGPERHLVISFLSGPALYVPRGQWQPLQALVATVVILIAALCCAFLAVYAAGYAIFGDAYEQISEEHSAAVSDLCVTLAPLLAALLTWFASGLHGDRPREVLQLDLPMPSTMDIVAAISGYTLLFSACVALRHAVDPATYLSDFAYLNTTAIQNLGQPYWPLVFPAAVIASIAADICFYGFLLSGLSKSRWGFWPPLVLITLPLYYAISPSLASGAQEFLLFLYACWLAWRSGRIWLVLFCNVWGVLVTLSISTIYAWT